jgi:hypothetical protein
MWPQAMFPTVSPMSLKSKTWFEVGIRARGY